MAITISSTNPSPLNINDTSTNITVNWSGATTGTNIYVGLSLLINGVSVGTATPILATSSGSISINPSSFKSAMYTQARGSAMSGDAVTAVVGVRLTNYHNIDGTIYGTAQTPSGSYGNLTLVSRITSLSVTTPNASNKFDLDAADITNFAGSWTRPSSSTAFYARIKMYVGNLGNGSSTTWTLVLNRYGFGASTNFDISNVGGTNYVPTFISAMAGASPKDLKVEIITQFDDGTADYKDLSGVSQTYTLTGGVVKQFNVPSTVASYPDFSIGTNPTVTLTTFGTNYHRLKFKLGTTVFKTVDWGTTSTGTISFTTTDWSAILDTFVDGDLSKVVTLDVETYTDSGYTTLLGTNSDTATASTSASTASGLANFNIEASNVLGFTLTKAYTGFTQTAVFKIGTTTVKTVTGSTGAAFTLSNGEKGTVYGTFTAGQLSKVFTLDLTTYYGAIRVGATQSYTATGSVTAGAVSTVTSPFSMSTSAAVNATTVAFSIPSTLFTYELRLVNGANTFTFNGFTTSPQTLQLTAANQITVIQSITNAMSATFTVQLITKYGTVQIGATDATKSIVGNFPALPPSFNINTPTEGNAANTTTFFLQNISKFNLALSSVSAQYSATISSAKITVDGTEYTVTSGGSWAALSNTLTSANTSGLVISATVIDSRGQTLNKTLTSAAVYPYSAPTVNFSLSRIDFGSGLPNPIGTALKIVPNITASRIPSTSNNTTTGNTLTITIRARQKPAGTWYTLETIAVSRAAFNTSVPYITDELYQYITGTTVFSTEQSYDVEITVADIFNTTTPLTKVLETGDVILSMLQAGVGVKKVHQQGALDVHGDIYTDASLRSTVATGTAPLVVASTTKVTNLNADLVDGYSAGNASGNIPISNGTLNTNLNADKLDGYDAGNASGNIPISNGTLNTNLNADKVDGYDAGNANGNIPISNGTLNTNLNADKVDGYDAGNASGNIPVSNGTVNTNLNADMLDGKHLGTTNDTIPVITTAKFTPTIAGTTTAGTGTYVAQKGEYTRIGNVVLFKIHLSWSAHSGTGNMQVNGFPFTSDSNGLTTFNVYTSALTLTGTGYNLQAYMNEASNIITLAQYQSGGGAAGVAMDTSATLLISGTVWI